MRDVDARADLGEHTMETDWKFMVAFIVYWLLAMYALLLAFKCNAAWAHFAAACICPPFYIAYVHMSLGGC